MNQITFKVEKEDKCLKELQIPIENASIEELISSLKTAKTLTNDYLTSLVNQEKSNDSKTRKIDEIASSDDDNGNVEESMKKQKKSGG